MSAASDGMMLLQAVLAFGFVVGLIFLSGVIVKKMGLDKRIIGNKGAPRLGVVETLYLDPKHRLVLVRCDSREHLLLIGAGGDRVIASHAAGEVLAIRKDAV